MNEKSQSFLNQIDIDNLICESVEKAVSRRQQSLDLEEHLIDISNEDAKNLTGGLQKRIIVMGYFAK
ncbi:hypothetical protein [Crocosphaera chwakensis]|uniref:Uncharacterized protein n=1 Tax=Crocosphaera chwakensis CCY0110 TaxID=391612 RepID=A3IKS3_9CHRO|nr:hypothetical protein [Crocosphaera chwakensis]EAZ92792.1 hypothetical protein CY0110_21887 [Crocosphaera chwakensis CCY0110]